MCVVENDAKAGYDYNHVKVIFKSSKTYSSMKRILFYILSMFLFTEVHSQTDWFPIGAEWYYEWAWPFPNDHPAFSRRYVVEKDTVVEGKTCQLICSEISKDIVFEENGIVYYYFNNKFRKIYDFTVKEGDVVEFEFKASYWPYDRLWDSTMIVPCTVETISSKFINGVELKEIHTSYAFDYETEPDNWLPALGRYIYIEKVGSELPDYSAFFGSEFIPYVSFDPGWTYHRLRCYHDSEVEYITEWWQLQNKPCDYDIVSNIIINNMKEEIIIFPNPVNDILKVSGVSGIARETTIVLFDATGKLVFKKKEHIPCDIHTGHLAPGIYYIHILDGTVLLTTKFIKL